MFSSTYQKIKDIHSAILEDTQQTIKTCVLSHCLLSSTENT